MMIEEKECVTLTNGVRLLMYPRADCTSAAIGIFVRAGAWNETTKEAGIAHVIEHMMFKSTQRYSTNWINDKFAEYGATPNAFTDYDDTCYYAQTPGENAIKTFELLSTMVLTPKFLDSELNTERGAILEEIGMRNDNHAQMTNESAHSHLFAKSGRFSMPIIGTDKIVKGLTSEDRFRFYNKHYVSKNIVIVAVGKFDIDKLVKRFAEMWESFGAGKTKVPLINSVKSGDSVLDRSSEQAHYCQIVNAEIRFNCPEFYAMQVLSTVYGDGCSSLLYREIRENRGLAYASYAYPNSYGKRNTLLYTYVGTSLKDLDKVIDLVDNIQKRLMDKKLSTKMLARGKANLVGSAMIQHDSVIRSMRQIGAFVMCDDSHFDTYAYADSVNNVTAELVQEVAQCIFKHSNKWTTYGFKQPTYEVVKK